MPVTSSVRMPQPMGDLLRLDRLTALEQSIAREEMEFAAMVERNAGFLYRIAYSLLRHRQDAEDAVQDCLLKLHRSGGWRGMREERAAEPSITATARGSKQQAKGDLVLGKNVPVVVLYKSETERAIRQSTLIV